MDLEGHSRLTEKGRTCRTLPIREYQEVTQMTAKCSLFIEKYWENSNYIALWKGNFKMTWKISGCNNITTNLKFAGMWHSSRNFWHPVQSTKSYQESGILFESWNFSIWKLGRNSVMYQQGYEEKYIQEKLLYYQCAEHNSLKKRDFLMSQNKCWNVTHNWEECQFTQSSNELWDHWARHCDSSLI